jgi:dihydrofolate reductase
MKIAALVLTDQNNAIGKNDLILTYLPGYVKYFEQLTKNAPIIMGKRTFESIGHILKSRKNIVITTNEKYHSSRAKTYSSLQDAFIDTAGEKWVFILGGADIFRRALPYTNVIYRTCLKARFKSDSYYPDIDTSEFTLESAQCINASHESRFDYCIEKWIRVIPKKEKAAVKK